MLGGSWIDILIFFFFYFALPHTNMIPGCWDVELLFIIPSTSVEAFPAGSCGELKCKQSLTCLTEIKLLGSYVCIKCTKSSLK